MPVPSAVPPRVPVSALAGGRIPVSDLTPMERKAKADAGEISADGFADVAAPPAPEMVDSRQADRKAAAARLTAPVPKVTPTVPAPTEVSPEAAEAPVHTHCQRCGLPDDEAYPGEPSKADIESFLAAAVAGEAWTKEFQIFGGKITVLLGTRSGAADEALKRVLNQQLREKLLVSNAEVITAATQYSLASSLRRYTTAQVDLNFEDISGDYKAFLVEADLRLASIPAQIQTALRPLLHEFNATVELLTARAQDPKFWTGTDAAP